MFTRNFCRVLLLALLSPTAALALGLGDVHLHSALNAPLNADIDLVEANAEDLAGLKASLASREDFKRSGLDYPSYLGSLTFSPGKTADGHDVIHVRSQDVVHEPLVTMLVAVDWARGHLVREYTLLLDPPVFSSESASNAPVAAPSAGASARSGSVTHGNAAEAGVAAPHAAAPRAAEPKAAAAASSGLASARGAPHAAAAGSYTVRRGDTLSGITTQSYPGADRSAHERELVAIYRANPEAFDGNMNVLRAGSHLSLPGDAEVAAISPGEALAEVRRQNASWNAGRGGNAAAHSGAGGSGQLRLVPPQEAAPPGAPGAAAAKAAAAGNGAALQQRVQQLESQLQESQRLLQMRSEELAALQARMAQGAGASGRPAAAGATPPAPAPAPAAQPAAKPAAPAAATTPPAVATAAPANQPVATPVATPVVTPKPAPKPKAAAGEAGNSIFDLIKEYWYVPAGLLMVLIALLVLHFVRARQEDEFDRSLGRLQPAIEPTASGVIRTSTDTVPVRALAGAREEPSYRVEESGSHEQPVFEEPSTHVSTIATGQHVAIDDTMTSGQPVALDQGDPLAEADFHMAYGLYDQAADLVQMAITREPQRRDLKLKLLEVFFVWGNRDRFLQSAHELAVTRDQALPGEWEKIVIMGRQIAPEDPLFTNIGAVAGVASGGVDLNLEGGQNRVDFDLLGEPSISAADAGVDLDFGAALGDADPTGEARKLGDSGVDFVLDDPERGNDSTGSTREMPGAPGATAQAAGVGAGDTATVQLASSAEADTPTVEQPQLHEGDNPTIRQKIDAAARSGMTASEQTAELAIDDLGLDLGTLEAGTDEASMPGGADAPTMLAGLDEDTRQLLARAEAERSDGGTGTRRSPAGAVPTTTGTWLFTDTDFATVVPPGGKPGANGAGADAPTELVTQISPAPTQIAPAPSFDTSSTSRLAALNKDELDLDFADLGAPSGVNGMDLGPGAVDLDVGAASAGEGTFVQTQKIASDEVALPELEPATMSEVGTKLDLARAYMDMGDPEGARSILSEVLSEGSVSQKQEARRLMDTLPG